MKGFEVLPCPGAPGSPLKLRFTLTDPLGVAVSLELELKSGLKLDQVLRSLKSVQKANR